MAEGRCSKFAILYDNKSLGAVFEDGHVDGFVVVSFHKLDFSNFHQSWQNGGKCPQRMREASSVRVNSIIGCDIILFFLSTEYACIHNVRIQCYLKLPLATYLQSSYSVHTLADLLFNHEGKLREEVENNEWTRTSRTYAYLYT
ncbi:hypothetical protein SARC_14201 [Sphaeroforma arctica JP610]|uniref:Uncharacterized protein n=1 Tax=Sphaeroforma arctica JP610 TaxID=667725 RepID=A0A0L0FAW6_9EUKA|nr:hypothetical protein SARC_14201 [Sphaeroforma arctica JP610]KNC73238.1 hypothetical protein SARC_14201 [Sphaeroforma arctica JP610]|eukprot:XP_014147140.1 hypothetical protein SARC_14201 [Sphaeroforma arctica JP610]